MPTTNEYLESHKDYLLVHSETETREFHNGCNSPGCSMYRDQYSIVYALLRERNNQKYYYICLDEFTEDGYDGQKEYLNYTKNMSLESAVALSNSSVEETGLYDARTYPYLSQFQDYQYIYDEDGEAIQVTKDFKEWQETKNAEDVQKHEDEMEREGNAGKKGKKGKKGKNRRKSFE